MSLDRFERCTILPSHFNDAGQFRRAEGLFVFVSVGHVAVSVVGFGVLLRFSSVLSVRLAISLRSQYRFFAYFCRVFGLIFMV